MVHILIGSCLLIKSRKISKPFIGVVIAMGVNYNHTRAILLINVLGSHVEVQNTDIDYLMSLSPGGH